MVGKYKGYECIDKGSYARHARTSPPYIYVTRTGILRSVVRRYWIVSEISGAKILGMLEGSGGERILGGFFGH